VIKLITLPLFLEDIDLLFIVRLSVILIFLLDFILVLEQINIESDRNMNAIRKTSFFNNEDNKKALNLLNEQLDVRSSPEQIASLICGDEGFYGFVSHTTIYKHIYADMLKGVTLHLHLRRRGVKYRTIAQKTEQAVIKEQSIETRINKK
jgi:IS30 family transposase